MTPLRRPLLALAALLLHAVPVRAQSDGPELRLTGLFRGGLRVEAEGAGKDGFELFDVRSGVAGRVGILFDYLLQVEYDAEADRIRLLDGYLTIPMRPDDLLDLQIGQLKAPFGREALISRADIPFVQRSQPSTALAPARQVGVRLKGRALEGRVEYWGGVFNGNGRTLGNDNDAFLYVARAVYNSIGDMAFYDDFAWQVAANVAFSRDSGLAILPTVAPREGTVAPFRRGDVSAGRASFTGERLLWGADVMLRWRGWFLNAEYLRGDFDVDSAAEPVPLDGGGSVEPGEELSAEGFYLEAGRRFLAAFEGIARYDAFRAAEGVQGEAGRNRFLMLGLNAYPGAHTKVGFQYTAGLSGSGLGTSIADGQFLTNFQLSF